MKITVLMGSPRKKDGYSVCKLIEDKMKQEAQFDYIFLRDYVVEDCRGCDMCFKKGEKFCPINDDINVIKQKLLDADGIIFVSPVYAYQVPAQLKRVIDRLSYLFHRQELVGKPAISIVTTGGGGHKQVSNFLKMTVSGWGCNLIGSINIISPMFFESQTKNDSPWGFDPYYYKSSVEKITKVCDNFNTQVKNNKMSVPSFYDVFMFNCLRSKTFTSKVDYEFWKDKGWLNSNYFYDVKIGVIKKMFGYTLKKIVESAGKRISGKNTV